MSFNFGASTGASTGFGAATPAIGASSTPAFGAASTPAFGASTAPAFGQASTPAFGAPASTPAFGAAASTPAFGAAASAPAFGAAAATPAAAPAATGFGGFATPAAVSQPAAAAAGTPAKPPETPAAPGFSTPLAGAAAAPGAAGTTATPGADTKPKMPSEITGKSVEEIIHSWNAELGRQTTAFGTYARSLSEWDRHIFRNRRTLLAMEEEMARVSSAQEALVRQLNVLDVHQKEVHETLQGMEAELVRLYEEESQHLDDSAVDRDQLFSAAEEVAAQLAEMGANLAQAIDLVNGSEQRSQAQAAADPLSSAMRILNNQLVTLQALDKKAQVLNRRVEQCDV